MNILIVDDDIVDTEAIFRVLDKSDILGSFENCNSVDKAITLLEQKPFDLVLLDYNLPQKDGIELLLELQDQRFEQNFLVIMISSSEDEKLAMKCIQAGAQDFLVKSEINAFRLQRAVNNASARFKLERELHESYLDTKRLAETDSLTGLANRYRFHEKMSQSLQDHARNPDSNIGLFILDLDQFKLINDSYGHDYGDELLKAVANRISECVRENELFARLGGDEFAIIFPYIYDLTILQKIAKRIIECFQTPFVLNDIEITTSTSIGISLYPQNASSGSELLKMADIALYRAKNLGRNTFCFFQQSMQDEFIKRYEIEQKIAKALCEDQLELFYQPVLSSADLTLQGFEALIRWNLDGVVVTPEQFIPIAEESGYINDIGRWVLQSAIKQLASWKNLCRSDLKMAINISAAQISDVTLPAYVQRLLDEHGVRPSQLEFELTETALIACQTKAKVFLDQLQAMGCSIALDDFGTGFSSITHLQNFPIDRVKIDRSIMPVNQDDQQLFRGLSSMLLSLGHTIVAEGVELKEQLDACQDMGIHAMQGFYFSKPLPSDEISKLYFS